MSPVSPETPPGDGDGQAAPACARPAAGDDPAVFVVEDDDAVRDAVTSALRAVGFQVVAFGSVRQFLDGYTGQRGCLVANVDPPGMSALELSSRLQASAWLLPTIFTSAQLGRHELDATRGRHLLLRKPYGMDELLPLIRLAILGRADDGPTT